MFTALFIVWIGQTANPFTVRSAPTNPFSVNAAKAGSTLRWYKGSEYAVAVSERDKTGKPVLVLLTDPVVCVDCRQLEAGALKDEKVINILSGYVCLKIDVTSTAGRTLADQFGAKVTPTIMVYRNGKLDGQPVTGNVSSAEMLKLLQPEVIGWNSPIPLPAGMKRYTPSTVTQRIAVTNSRDTIQQAPIRDLESKWHGSGGMVGLTGWKSEKFKNQTVSVSRIADISVLNGLGYFQNNRGIVRTYPDGTRFDDVLSNDQGDVFEHRTREKQDGRWKSQILFSNESARPKGYTGLSVACSSCHNQAGTGGYATGLIPGGDTVLSDPLDWSLVGGR